MTRSLCLSSCGMYYVVYQIRILRNSHTINNFFSHLTTFLSGLLFEFSKLYLPQSSEYFCVTLFRICPSKAQFLFDEWNGAKRSGVFKERLREFLILSYAFNTAEKKFYSTYTFLKLYSLADFKQMPWVKMQARFNEYWGSVAVFPQLSVYYISSDLPIFSPKCQESKVYKIIFQNSIW